MVSNDRDDSEGNGLGRPALQFRGYLEEELDKPRSDWDAGDLLALFHDLDIRILSLLHVGGDGCLKRLDFAPRGVEHLEQIIHWGERADGSSLFPGAGIPAGASDIVLRPRVRTAFLDPFSPIPALMLLCGHAGPDGRPLAVSPDTIVRRAGERLRRETGCDLWALGEVEYFLGKHSDESDIYGAHELGYHATAPYVTGGELRREAMAILADMGVPVKYGHSEVGYIEADEALGVHWEQHEIELDLMPLHMAADGIILTQWVLRNLAHREGLPCTMDPMMREGHAGNGLHFHLSPVREGRHVGGRMDDGRLSDPTRWIIGGLVRLGGALMAFGNRDGCSFARLIQGKEAPREIVWGELDRSALIRLPVTMVTDDGRPVSPPTVEFRLPDGSAFPHLLLAGVAQAMAAGAAAADLDDLLERTASGRAGNGAGAAAPVPRDFAEVAAALVSHRQALEEGDVFPAPFLDRLIERLLEEPEEDEETSEDA